MTDLLTPAPDTRKKAHRDRWLGVLAVAVLVLVAVGFIRWGSRLDVVAVYGQSGSAPVQVGQTYYIDAGVGPVPGTDAQSASMRVTLDAVNPSVEQWATEATSGTTVTVIEVQTVVCIRRPNSDGVGITLVSDLAASRSEVQRLALPETLDLGFTTTQVLYKVAITGPGTHRNFAISLEYHHGLRHGAVHGSTDLSLNATR